MNSGNANTFVNTSAFTAVMDQDLSVTDIKIYAFNKVTGEQAYAAAWSIQQTLSGYHILGVVGTDNHHVFYAPPISSSTLDIDFFYPNTITGTTLLTFQTPDSSFAYYAYFIQTSAVGDREILVNWKRRDMSYDSKTWLLHKTGYDVFHTRRQIPFNTNLWSGYVYQNNTGSSKVFIK